MVDEDAKQTFPYEPLIGCTLRSVIRDSVALGEPISLLVTNPRITEKAKAGDCETLALAICCQVLPLGQV